MEYLKWNRKKLIDEIKTASQLMVFKIFTSEIKVDGSLSSYNYQDDDKLKDKTDPELRNIYFTVKKYDAEFQQQHRDYVENNQFYNQTAVNADYSHWCKQPFWSIDEGVILTFGKDPRKVKWDDVKQYAQHSAFVKKFQERRETAQRYVACKKLSDSNYTGDFIIWAQSMGYSVPAELVEGVKAVGVQMADYKMLHNQATALIGQKDKLIEGLSQNIVELERKLETKKDNLHVRTEKNYKNIIAILLEYIEGETPNIPKHPSFTNLTKLIEVLAEKYDGYEGMSVSNLSRKLPEAKETLKNQ